MVSKRPISSLLCNISFIEIFRARRYIKFLLLSFGETSFELENPRSQKEGRFRRVDKTFFPLGPGSTLGEACGFSGAHA